VVLPEADFEEAGIIANRLLAATARSYTVNGHDIALGASIGVALFPQHGTAIEELLSRADAACHQAKLQGRNTVQFYDDGLNSDASEQLQLESALRGAADRNELELYYQPQIDLRHGGAIGFEALLRWRHPKLGLVPPDRFIPIAESRGLMPEIGNWVLRRACEQGRLWLDNGLACPTLAINISVAQLRSGTLHEEVSQALAESRLPAHLLELELTESLLLKDMEECMSQFDRLKRSLGVKLAIDDFGTGYSNLAYLGSFPADKLKIDRSFISGMRTNERCRAIVETIIRLGHTLHFEVIAEGVETEEDRALLIELGCDHAQGYLIGRPMPAMEALHWWRERYGEKAYAH
jgi:EAL domain-containing protein (putative c-di-GMP-specific phosphodiesterase class I)